MKLRWEDIPPEGREVSLDELLPFCLQGPHGEEEKKTRLASAVKGNLFLRRTPKGIEAKGRIETAVCVHCARCLKEFVLPIVSEFEAFFLLIKYAPREEEKELAPEEMGVSFLPEGELEVRDIIEEQIWLNIPMKPLCHDGCKGLCSICGADLNLGECGCDRGYIDPRFAVLKGLIPNLPQGSK
ncbi:MAG: DUF177 domain-containing protein [Deltaproteobacteria bacterium]|nr:DUF177 domain-containing protein [Deltaproteobacteria bacterium]